MISYIRGFASKLEAENIRERTIRGKSAYVKMGKFPIRTGKGLYGYKWDSNNKKRILLEFEAKIVEEAFLMRANHDKTYKIARTLDEQGWQNIKEVLSKLEILLACVSEQLELERNVPRTTLDREIQKLKRRLKSYEAQEKRLIQLLRYEEVTQDAVLDEINQLKKERESDRQKLENYIFTRE